MSEDEFAIEGAANSAATKKIGTSFTKDEMNYLQTKIYDLVK